MTRIIKNLLIIFLVILLIYPIAFWSKIFWHHIGSLFDYLEKFIEHYAHIFQALTSLGILIIPFYWWRWRRGDQENIARNLSSISVSVNRNAVAEIKNTSSVDGSELFIKVYRPYNFEKAERNKEFMKYVTGVDKNRYLKKKKLLSQPKTINWNSDPLLTATLSIGEIVNFHLKNIEQDLFIHFAPVKIIISPDRSFKKPKEKYMLFRFAPLKLRSIPTNEFITKQLHPYEEWILVYSR